ncbi:SRPBCC family protein [Fusibacter sp. JL298sf-3]
MQYTVSIDINQPLDVVIEHFSDLEGRYRWQVGLKSMTCLKGNGFEVGTQSELVFSTGKQTMTMTETILKNDCPHCFSALYTVKGVRNFSEDCFESLGENRTRYTSHQTFEMQSLVMKLIGLFMPRMFKKQTTATLEAFKAYCEH